MSFKEWNAAIMLAGQAVVSGWLIHDAVTTPNGPGPVEAVATRLLYAIGFMVVFNVVATVAVTLWFGVVRRQVLEDERADERDQAIAARSMRNAYYVASVGGACTLLLLAFGVDPPLAAYALFSALMLGAAADSVSKLVYYRLG